MSALMMTNHLDHKCKQNSSENSNTNGAGQSEMQTTDRKQSANWLQRWALIMALAVFPAWALAQSDLVMTAVNTTTPQVNTLGGSIYFTDTVKNQGATASTTMVRIGYYLSTDQTITASDTLIGSHTVGTLGVGVTGNWGGYIAVPAGLTPGTYYLGALADDTGLEPESDETNNGGVASASFNVALPDLVMTAVNTTTTQMNTLGGTIYFTDTVKNQGIVASTKSVRIGYYLSTDQTITASDTLIGSHTVGTLGVGVTGNWGGYIAIPAGLTPGTYYLGALADDNGLEPESDEANNGLAAVSTFTIAQSDLVMTSVSSTTTQINTLGGYISVSDTLKNQAAVASTVGVRVGYYLSTDNVITAADTLLGYRTVGTVAAGANNINTGYLYYAAVPAGMAPGTYYLGAIADYSGLEAESDETNNGLAGMQFTIALPDLVMTAVSSTTNKINTLGGYITVSDTLKNQAAVASTVTNVRVGYYLSTDNIITTADTFLGYRAVGTVAAGASNINTGISNIATVPAGMPPGTYYLGAIADYSGLQAEADETNNALPAVSTFTITLPDLVVTSVSSGYSRALPGMSITVNDTIKNQAAVSSTNAGMRLGYYLSTDNVITTTDTFLGYRVVGKMVAGNSDSYGIYTTVPAGMAPGTYYLGAIADYSGLEAESDETNNTLAGQFIAIGPDLVMTSVSTTSTAAIPGNAISIADSFKNQGLMSSSGCRLVGYYLSTDTSITTTDILIGSRQHCGALALTGTSVNPATNITIPSATASGTYYLGAIVDYTGLEAEADETNNTLLATGASILIARLPDAPTNVNATGGYTKATVSFTASASDGGAAITGYSVTSSPAGGVDSNAGSTGLSHIVTGLTNGVAYTFTVRATNVMGTGLASTASNSVIPAPTAPDAPANVTAVHGYTKGTISFTAPAENGAAITGYSVTSSPAGGVDSNAGSTGLSHVVRGLVNGTAYTFTVTATNAIGTGASSTPSNSIIPAPTAPDAPANVKAAGGNTQATISFTAPAENGSPITGYTVTSDPLGVTASGTGSPITVTGLINGAAYTFTVTSTNAIGTSPASLPSNSILAMILPQAYYVHTDHLDTPRQITDTAGNVVWQRDNTDPFGNNIANENPSGLGKFTCNLGFPGQYFDIETGLFYNRLRDGYDPATGRYTQGDPVGLYGGSWSIFIYAGGNPLSWIDPWGLTHYNAPPPQTVPPTGRVAEQLSCMDRCTGKDLLITGGKEKKGHKGKKHGENKACDIAGPEFNSELDDKKVFSCAVQCGFTNGQYEDFPGVSRDHWHLQDGSGSGVPELPPGSLWDRFKHQINEITLPKE